MLKTIMRYTAVILSCVAALNNAGAQTHRLETSRIAPVVLARDQINPAAIDVDETNVYWVSDSRSGISKVKKRGGTVTTIVSGQENIRRMTVDKDMIYFLTDDEVRKVSTSGGNPTTLVAFSSIGGKNNYYYFALDQKNVYFVNDRPESGQQIMKMDKSGGKPAILVPQVYAPSGVVSDGANVYWIEYANDEVQKVDIQGGPAVTIGECTDPMALAVDGAGVYCSNKQGEIIRFAKTGGASSILATVKDAGFDRLAVDEKTVYALSVLKGIYRIDKSGRPPVLLVPLNGVSANLAIDASNIYWSNYNEGTVMRRSK
jgi:streptogramin lyase